MYQEYLNTGAPPLYSVEGYLGYPERKKLSQHNFLSQRYLCCRPSAKRLQTITPVPMCCMAKTIFIVLTIKCLTTFSVFLTPSMRSLTTAVFCRVTAMILWLTCLIQRPLARCRHTCRCMHPALTRLVVRMRKLHCPKNEHQTYLIAPTRALGVDGRAS